MKQQPAQQQLDLFAATPLEPPERLQDAQSTPEAPVVLPVATSASDDRRTVEESIMYFFSRGR